MNPNHAPPSYDSARYGEEPLFHSPAVESTPSFSSYPNVNQTPTQEGAVFGAPPMGEPSAPSAHPDNRTAATQAPGSSTIEGVPTNIDGSSRVGPTTGGLGRQPSGSFDKAAVGGGGGLRRQPSGAYDTASANSGFASGPTTNTVPTKTSTSAFKQTPSQPGVAGTTPVGVQPGSPYVQTEDVPQTGKSSMTMLRDNFNKYMSKAEGLAGNVWGHLKVGPSVTDAAWGRMTQGARLVTEGGYEGVYKATFGMVAGEQLRKTYACYLSTSTGPVAGTLYISNLKFSFCSDRPLSYAPTAGQQAWSYYKVVVPLDKVKEVIPSYNESKPLEKYIQILTQDGHDFWFMGFINYDKGVTNLQLALQHIGEIDPNGGLKGPFGQMRPSAYQPGVPPNPPNTQTAQTTAMPPPNYSGAQGTTNPYTVNPAK